MWLLKNFCRFFDANFAPFFLITDSLDQPKTNWMAKSYVVLYRFPRTWVLMSALVKNQHVIAPPLIMWNLSTSFPIAVLWLLNNFCRFFYVNFAPFFSIIDSLDQLKTKRDSKIPRSSLQISKNLGMSVLVKVSIH